MFGLMRRAPRLPYCGTCKTLGASYGQATRLLLNHDTVFLAELLLAHSAAPEWSSAHRSFNCLTMPKAGESPVALEFAAAATIALAHYRVIDHRADSRQTRWDWAARLLSPSYRRAAARLRDWGFPVAKLAEILDTQVAREANPESLAHVAEPTALATALFFSHGARVVGREDLSESMHRIGHRFGFLIYALDAFEDRERDAKRGDFNPLLALSGVDARAEILSAVTDLERELPADLAHRLRTNVEERLGMRLRVLHYRCRKTVRERWSDAKEFARSMREREAGGVAKGALVFGSAAVVAFAFPHQVRSAESWRHALGLTMNLIAVGGVFAMASAVPPPLPGPGPGIPTPQVATPPKSGGCGCGSCCCDPCSECSCDCCCEGCCCEGCCCDSCDCG